MVGIHQASGGGALMLWIDTEVSSAWPIEIEGSLFNTNLALSHGGAVYIFTAKSSVRILHRISGSSDAAARVSIVVWLQVSTSVTVRNTIFVGNFIAAGEGGAVAVHSEYGTVDLNLYYTTFQMNTAPEAGGGLSFKSQGSFHMDRGIVHSNCAGAYDAGACNAPTGIAAGIILGYGGIVPWKEATILASTFTSNKGNQGGGLTIVNGARCSAHLPLGSIAHITNCIFSGNVVGASGGGLNIDGAMYIVDGSTFSGNSVGTIGGADIYEKAAAGQMTYWGYKDGTGNRPNSGAPSNIPCYCYSAGGSTNGYCLACLAGSAAHCVYLLTAVPSVGSPVRPIIKNSVMTGARGTGGAYGASMKFDGGATALVQMVTVNDVYSTGAAALGLDVAPSTDIYLENVVFSKCGAVRCSRNHRTGPWRGCVTGIG